MLSLPMAPLLYRSRAFSVTTELTGWLPTWRTLPVSFSAATRAAPSSIFWTMGFST